MEIWGAKSELTAFVTRKELGMVGVPCLVTTDDDYIFEVADLGIVGEVQKVLPLVIDEIKKINATKKIQD